MSFLKILGVNFILASALLSNGVVLAEDIWPKPPILPTGRAWTCHLMSESRRTYTATDDRKEMAEHAAYAACINAEPAYLCRGYRVTISCAR